MCMSDETSPRYDRSLLLFPSWTKADVRDLTDLRLSVLLFGEDTGGQEQGCRNRVSDDPVVTRCIRAGAGS